MCEDSTALSDGYCKEMKASGGCTNTSSHVYKDLCPVTCGDSRCFPTTSSPSVSPTYVPSAPPTPAPTSLYAGSPYTLGCFQNCGEVANSHLNSVTVFSEAGILVEDWSEYLASHLSLIVRTCSSCVASHQTIVYKRKTSWKDIDVRQLFLENWFTTNNGGSNILNTDFELYSSYDDAIRGVNPWTFCNYNDPGIGFPRDCGPNGHVASQWNSLYRGGKSVTYTLVSNDGTGIIPALPVSGCSSKNKYNACGNVTIDTMDLPGSTSPGVACRNHCENLGYKVFSLTQDLKFTSKVRCGCCTEVASDCHTLSTSECKGGPFTSGLPNKSENGGDNQGFSGIDGKFTVDGFMMGGHCRAAVYSIAAMKEYTPPGDSEVNTVITQTQTARSETSTETSNTNLIVIIVVIVGTVLILGMVVRGLRGNGGRALEQKSSEGTSLSFDGCQGVLDRTRLSQRELLL